MKSLKKAFEKLPKINPNIPENIKIPQFDIQFHIHKFHKSQFIF